MGKQRGMNPIACALPAEESLACMRVRANVRSADSLAVSIGGIASVRTAVSEDDNSEFLSGLSA